MKKLITMVMDAASAHHVPVTICGLAVGNPANTAQYLHLGLRSFSVSPQNLLMHLPGMGAAFHCLRFYIPMLVSMTANIAGTVAAMM